jgi:hypothetical protein
VYLIKYLATATKETVNYGEYPNYRLLIEEDPKTHTALPGMMRRM